MTIRDIIRLRLQHQQLTSSRFTQPEQVVRWMGAVQAQDFPGAKWGIGQRMKAATDDDVERAFADGRIVRTHVMRPTWHFVAAGDLRWLLALTGPRVHAGNRGLFRRLGVTAAELTRSRRVLERSLRDGAQLTRSELRQALHRGGLEPATGPDKSLHTAYLLITAELDAVICSGARKGRQFTYALVDERVPPTPEFTRDEALAELTRRYFTGHGPAQLKDFAWWSGLTIADGRRGVGMLGRHLEHAEIDGATYWWSRQTHGVASAASTAHLLPLYDEYLIAFKDRSAVIPADAGRPGGSAYDAPIVWNGRLAGSWTRTLTKGRAAVTIRPFTPLTARERTAFQGAARRYATFLGPGTAPDGATVAFA